MHYQRKHANLGWRSSAWELLQLKYVKAIHNVNPKFMKDISNHKSNANIRPFDRIANARKTNKFGNKSLTVLDPKISN